MHQCALLILLVFALSATGRVPSTSEGVRARPTLETLLDSLHRLMVFFSERYDKLNVDGLFGIRAVQGELNRALLRAKSGEYPIVQHSPEVWNKINEILHLADNTAERALPEVKKKNQQYFKNFVSIIEKPWTMFELSPQKLKKGVEKDLPSEMDKNVKSNGREDDFNEEMSDKCMGTLLGNGGSEKCDVNTCWEMMSRPGTRLYFTTHQILWFQLGIKAGCQLQFKEKVSEYGGIEKIFQRLCHNVIFQMDAMFRDGNVAPPYQDIFLEKGMICGGMGFMDAVNLTWLEGAMKWQHRRSGCFREIALGITAEEADQEFEDMLINKKKEWRSRNLLEDAEMGDFCSAHKSAVAAGFYAVYTRLFLDPEYAKHQLWPDLYGQDYDPAAVNVVMRYLACGFVVACFLLCAIGKRRLQKFVRPFSLFGRKF